MQQHIHIQKQNKRKEGGKKLEKGKEKEMK